MRDISLHLLDLAQNSITAKAKHIRIEIDLDKAGWLKLAVIDDGCGMTHEDRDKAIDPFFTTRKTRNVGLGIPLTAANASLTGGTTEIKSAPGQGTTFIATFNTRHIDCLPLGDISSTFTSLVIAHPDTPEFSISCTSPNGAYYFSTSEVKKILNCVPLSEPEVIKWINETIHAEIISVFGGIEQ